MEWKSLQEIKDFFKIKDDKIELKEIREELLSSLTQIHPDKNGGDFKSGWQQEQYYKIKDAIEFIDSLINKSTSLITVDNVTDIIKVVTQALKADNEKPVEKKESELKENFNREIRRVYGPIKIGSGSIAAICTGLLTFSKNLNENPVLAPLYNIPFIHTILFIILFLSAIWYVDSWINERKADRKKEWLFSEEGKLVSLSRLLRSSYTKEKDNKKIFGLLDYIFVLRERKFVYHKNKIIRYGKKIITKFLDRVNISLSMAEDIAHFHIIDFERRGILKKSNLKSIELYYEIEIELCEDIVNKYYYYKS